jgi:hypothetical protein
MTIINTIFNLKDCKILLGLIEKIRTVNIENHVLLTNKEKSVYKKLKEVGEVYDEEENIDNKIEVPFTNDNIYYCPYYNRKSGGYRSLHQHLLQKHKILIKKENIILKEKKVVL